MCALVNYLEAFCPTMNKLKLKIKYFYKNKTSFSSNCIQFCMVDVLFLPIDTYSKGLLRLYIFVGFKNSI